MISVSEIADRLNEHAGTLAPELLPNGHRSGNKWMASGIADTGHSASLYVHLSGEKIGHWCDMGNAAAGEEKGDMLDLLRLTRGLDAAGAVAEAKRRLGIVDLWGTKHPRPDLAEQRRLAAEAQRRQRERAEKEAQANAARAKRVKALFLSGEPIKGTPAEAYLLNRGLEPDDRGDWPGALHFHGEVWNSEERCKLPAMLAAIYDAQGNHIGTHRTYLQADHRHGWGKLNSLNAKKVLGQMWGGFIPISKGKSGKSMRHLAEGEPVYVTEGIEDAIVVRMYRPELRVIACISLPNFGGLVLPPPPPGAQHHIVFCCDRDLNEKAQNQLERAIGQQQARGHRVSYVIPPEPHKDLNDWHCALKRRARRASR